MEIIIDAYKNVHMSEGELRWSETHNTINFTIDRFNEDNVDLSEYNCYVYYINTKNILNKILIESILVESATLFFQWEIDIADLYQDGVLKLQISFEGEKYMWQSHLQLIGIHDNNITILKEGELYWPKTLK